MTVGKINFGLKANVLIVPFLVEDIGHTCAHIPLASKAHISGLGKWKVQCISMQSPWHGTVSLLTQFNL